MKRLISMVVLVTATLPLAGHAGERAPAAERALGHRLLEQMVGTDTTLEHGTSGLVKALAQRFLQAGFPPADVKVTGGDPKYPNLVVRLHGRNERPPILLLAHLDVVPVHRASWHYNPFELTEHDGYFYGRGTMDIKGAGAGFIATLLRFHKQGFKPKGDYILALTAGEETGVSNGVQWLLANRPDLIKSEYSINADGGGPEIPDGQTRPDMLAVETAEKAYASYTLTAHGPGGHSSIPQNDNPIYRLAKGLARLSSLEFPLATNSASRAYYGHLATLNSGQLAADMRAVARDPSDPAALRRLATSTPYNDAHLRTTCVPTLLTGGDAENALPQVARATVNCRIMPGVPPAQVEARIRQALADPAITLAPVAPVSTAPPSPVNHVLFAHIARAARREWGRPIPVSEYMSSGASDSVFLRAAGMPSYVFNGIAYNVNDDRSHAPNERIRVNSFYQSLEFDYLLLKSL